MNKNELFASARPAKALAVMALPTVASQMILLIYNLADTWFIGRTNDPAMVGASNVALIAYNFGAKNKKRVEEISSLALRVNIVFALVCSILYWFAAAPLVGIFMEDEATVSVGAVLLMGRCFALPFMMVGYHVVNYMNAIGKGKISFLLAFVRHLVLIIPILLIFNHVFGLIGLIWSQIVADFINAINAFVVFTVVRKKNGLIGKEVNS